MDAIARGLALSGPRILAQSGTAVSHTGDTNEAVLASIPIPAGAMGKNGKLAVECIWTVTNSANNKTLNVKLGSTAFCALSISGTLGALTETSIYNRNSQSSQIGFAPGAGGKPGGTGLANVTAAIDTSVAQTLTITGQLALGTETITLESYQVVLYPKN